MKHKEDIFVPMDVPKEARAAYIENFQKMTRNTGRLMLFAGDQKIEHLNDDFFGDNIAPEDNDPEHMFRIASQGTIGVFAAQLGLIARYGNTYDKVQYLVKLNSKSHIVKPEQIDPKSDALWSVSQVMEFKKNSGLSILGVGYTIYLGSEYENSLMKESANIINEAHRNGLISVLWIYPRGKAVKEEKNPHLIAGATGVAACLGSDFVKVNYPKKEGMKSEEIFREAIVAAGRTRVVCAGGGSIGEKEFLEELHKQIHISGAMGNATGRNLHQKPLSQAVRMCDAISSITLGNRDVEFAMRVYQGKEEFRI